MKELLLYLFIKILAMFTKEERSTFKYWFAHWCAFNMTALNLKVWKPKYLFHDIEKPWMRLFLPYKKVQHWHRYHNSHHMEYYLRHGKADWEAMIIDWECSRFTKENCPLNARGEFEKQIKHHELDENAITNLNYILKQLGL